MADVVLRDVVKRFDNVEAVRQISLDIPDKEFVVLVGPSGCGKSTTLRMIAGLEEASSGEIYIDGEVVNDVPPKDRDIAMVFQNYALYPHMTVFDNMAFGLKMRRLPKQEIRERVALEIRLQVEDGGGTIDAFVNLRFWRAAQLHRERHIGGDRHVRIERVVPEHHGDVALFGRHVIDHALANADLAGSDIFEPRDHAQQRRLAASRWAHQHHELAVADEDADAVDDLHCAKSLPHVADRDWRHSVLLPAPNWFRALIVTVAA